MAIENPCDHTVSDILSTIRELNHLQDVDMILSRILLESRRLARADAGSIFLRKNRDLVFSHVQNDTLFGPRGARAAQYTNQSIPINDESIVGYSALTKEVVVIDDAYQIDKRVPYSFNASFDEKNNYHTASILTIPLISSDDTLVGIMQLINALDDQGKPTTFSVHSRTYVPLFANNAAVTIERGILNRELILRMVKMAELHDPKETGAHVRRVAAYCAEIYQRWAEKKQLPAKQIKHFRDQISLASMLHDAGKVGITDTILKKPGRLTPEEFDVIKKHTIYGARLFTNIATDLDRMTHDVILHHHEKWNGQGYPGQAQHIELADHRRPLQGEEIPLSARITALADVYDALCSQRCYKESWDDDKVYAIIRKEAGEHFDPELVEAFFEITDILQAIREKFQ